VPETRAVIFDMDGVLIDSGAHHREAWRRLLAELGAAPAAGFWRRTIGRPSHEARGPVVAAVNGPPGLGERGGEAAGSVSGRPRWTLRGTRANVAALRPVTRRQEVPSR
jgi:beta-phosphoglucomutase-like phosphatase (HAD superfamily)